MSEFEFEPELSGEGNIDSNNLDVPTVRILEDFGFGANTKFLLIIPNGQNTMLTGGMRARIISEVSASYAAGTPLTVGDLTQKVYEDEGATSSSARNAINARKAIFEINIRMQKLGWRISVEKDQNGWAEFVRFSRAG